MSIHSDQELHDAIGSAYAFIGVACSTSDSWVSAERERRPDYEATRMAIEGALLMLRDAHHYAPSRAGQRREAQGVDRNGRQEQVTSQKSTCTIAP